MFSKEYINLLLTIYFLLFGIGGLTKTISPIFSLFLPKSKQYSLTIKIPLTAPWPIKYTFADVIALIVASGIVVWYSFTKNWIINNVIGFSFCVQGIGILSITSFQIASFLLIGLFFYDIFWVFGTDVMVTVAKNFDAPIKFLYPKNIFAATYQFSMLGLGHIVIPGVFIALMLRFDRKKTFPKLELNKLVQVGYNSIPRVYFTASLVAYILGLLTTISVMHFFKAAQPALLYLVPFCLGVAFFTAVIRKEVGQLISYTEELPEKPKAD